jgi:hypothetical protein
MTDSIAELVKQARVIVEERGALTSNKLRQALNLIANGPRIDKDAVGGTKFKIALALRYLCLSYRGLPRGRHASVLAMIEQGIDLLAGMDDDPDAVNRHWMQG